MDGLQRTHRTRHCLPDRLLRGRGRLRARVERGPGPALLGRKQVAGLQDSLTQRGLNTQTESKAELKRRGLTGRARELGRGSTCAMGLRRGRGNFCTVPFRFFFFFFNQEYVIILIFKSVFTQKMRIVINDTREGRTLGFKLQLF